MTAPSDKRDAREIRLARPGLDAEVTVPGSKSITNRALLLAALARGESTLTGALAADDTRAFATALRSLGFSVDKGAEGWRVQGAAGRIPAREADVYCAEAGTAARFLLAA
ncbi:MAG TPA: 3-phosphoshikimate 1-carboxyvinyltransferase, partial [Dehalococcoidia bacterium]|nr:3-phosphoshikimate 1-carboxyvinyltransferase [Dehalococcoidia bacterium]